MPTHRSLILWLMLPVIWVFLPVRHFQFILFDDNVHIYENPNLTEVNTTSLKNIWEKPYFGMYIPLTYSVWALETKLGRTIYQQSYSPALLHLGNLIFHLVNVLLVFSLLKYLGFASLPGAVAALFFGVHPLQVEAVAWIACLKDLLSTALGLLALIAFLRMRRWPFVYLISYAGALLAKPSASVVPAIGLLLAYFKTQRLQRRQIIMAAFSILIGLPIIFITRALQPNSGSLFEVPTLLRPLVAFDALAFYLQKIFLPLHLTLDYGRSPQWILSQGLTYVIWLVPVGIALYLFNLPKNKWILAGSGFVLSLLPVLGFFEFRFQQYSTVADRYLYLPLFFVAVALANALSYFSRRQQIMVGTILILILGFSSRQQLAHWQDSQHLFDYMAKQNPQSLIAHNNLGNIYERHGNFTAALAEYQRALSLKPDWLDARYNIANILCKQQRFEPALQALNEIIQLKPDYVDAYYNQGTVYTKLGRIDEAIASFEKGLHYKPRHPQLLNKLGTAYISAGRYREATQVLERSLAAFPNAEALNNLGVIRMRQRHWPEAIRLFERALQISPDYRQAQDNLSVSLVRR